MPPTFSYDTVEEQIRQRTVKKITCWLLNAHTHTQTHTDFSLSALNKSPQKPGGKAVWFKWSLWWIYKIKLHFIIEDCPFTTQRFWIISTKVLPFMKTSTRRKFHLNQTSEFSGLLRLLNPRDWWLSKPKCSNILRKECKEKLPWAKVLSLVCWRVYSFVCWATLLAEGGFLEKMQK